MPVVITAQHEGRKNAMVVARHTVVSSDPATYGISISSTDSFTYQMILKSREFGVNFLPFEQAALVDALGSSKGRDVDKFQKFNLAVKQPEQTSVPILDVAYAAYECKLLSETEYGRSRWLLGEIVAMHALPGIRAEEGVLDMGQVNPLLYLGEQRYLAPDKDTLKYVPR
ncbi:MAG: flavin reductase family protein [Chloroflexi bacterium]|nr:flavin reductase family protein [Chloroflexota bacterium]